ncbi:SpoIIE family protein phosphatase [Skermania sp. ID1734]|nr:SpoIIE family protein phosphatase [Skermania sp. ID1734]
MTRRMRAFAWADTDMGAPDQWPSVLQTAVRICLTSRFPMIVWWGEELRFLYNDAYLPLLGDKHPALGKPGERVWTEIWHTIGPMLDSVMNTGRATWSEDLLLPMQRHGYWEETYWTYSYSPLHDDDGTVRGVFTAVSDTTERVVGERRLAALHHLGAQAGSAHDVDEACTLVAAALDRARKDVPYAAIYLRDESSQLHLASVTPPSGREIAVSALDRGWPIDEVLRSGEASVLSGVAEQFGPLPAGGWPTPPAEAMVLPLVGDAGQDPIGVIVLAASAGRAMRESYQAFLQLVARQTAALINAAIAYQAQQRRAEELAELDRAKTTFFSNISHEFRTPLTLIMGPVVELRARCEGADEQAHEALEMIHRNGLRLGKLVNTLLDFSRIEAGRMQARYEPVDLAETTAELASVFRSAIDRAGLTLDIDCAPLPEPVYLDHAMWEKVVLNLISNALKFTFTGGITVRVRDEGKHAVVSVADTGIGISESEMPRLFERFHRIANVRSRSNEGSGIGLALVGELVALHKGTISVDSAENVGTTFTIQLHYGSGHLPPEAVVTPDTAVHAPGQSISLTAEPFVQEALRWNPGPNVAEPAPVAELEPAAPTAAAAVDRPVVLVADDNADMRDYLRRLLSPAYRVRLAADGAEALDTARADPPDLIVSDVMMPRLDGLELVSALRTDSRTAAVPILLLSARAGEESAIEGLQAGADDYLVKPFSAADLLARARANVELARMRSRHANWRSALVDSLQEGFFVADAAGTVIEINSTFTDLLGYGVDGLPYAVPHPWWPDPDTDPEGFEELQAALARIAENGASNQEVVPLDHRDGRRLWIATSVKPVIDPETGELKGVGTLRDVTVEHYGTLRETALANLGTRLAEASTVTEALTWSLEELAALWRAKGVIAAIFADDFHGGVKDAKPHKVLSSYQGDVEWAALPDATREALEELRRRTPLDAQTLGARQVGISVEHPEGVLVLLIELALKRRLGPADASLLAALAGHIGQTLRRAHHSDQERETALQLQRAILGPAKLPPGFAVRYEPATRPLEIGGDWYDIVHLSGRRIGIVVGDCVGRGLEAAAIMGQLRSAAHAVLLNTSAPDQTLEALDHFAAGLPGAMCTTVFCAVLDLSANTVTYSSAGHPPAVFARADGTAELLTGGHGPALALRRRSARSVAIAPVEPGSVLLIYTDGLVERRGELLDEGIAAAADLLCAQRDLPVHQLADVLMTELAPAIGFDDDVALLLFQPPPELHIAFAPRPTELAPARNRLREWLTDCNVEAADAHAILIAVGEACTNSIEHAFTTSAGQTGIDSAAARVTVTASMTGAECTVTVTDNGWWRPPEISTLRGRGLLLMRGLMDDVELEPSENGTSVRMRKRLNLSVRVS